MPASPSASDFLDVTEADFDRVIGINLKGSFLMLQACARHMVKQAEAGRKPGAIVNMSSVNDTLAIPAIVSYCMSKGGVSQLTRATSIALAPHGIRVNAIGPGTIGTDMCKGVLADKAAMNRAMSRTPLGRAGRAFGSGRPSPPSSRPTMQATSPARRSTSTAAACR